MFHGDLLEDHPWGKCAIQDDGLTGAEARKKRKSDTWVNVPVKFSDVCHALSCKFSENFCNHLPSTA